MSNNTGRHFICVCNPPGCQYIEKKTNFKICVASTVLDAILNINGTTAFWTFCHASSIRNQPPSIHWCHNRWLHSRI